MFCLKCGAQNEENNFKCIKCGQPLHSSEQVCTADYGFGGLIPYRNSSALIAYYLGVFSIIPCLGIFLGIAALILGIKGLKFAKQHPEVKGRAHAWIGILVGGFFGFVYSALTIILIFMMITTKK